MNFYQLTIQYDGSQFSGWQIQSQGERTVQEELIKAARKIAKSEDVKIMASGRTDAGVHALGQVVKLTWPLDLPNEKVIKAFNANLPSDIVVKMAYESDADFHPIFSAKKKEYHYLFTHKNYLPPFAQNYVSCHKYDLDIDKLHEASKLLIGEHDFKNFHTVGSDIKTSVREIYSCEIAENSFSSLSTWNFPVYCLKIQGNGFLKHMVRMLVGALWEVARGKSSIEDFQKALDAQEGFKIYPTAPPNGLYLNKVEYSCP